MLVELPLQGWIIHLPISRLVVVLITFKNVACYNSLASLAGHSINDKICVHDCNTSRIVIVLSIIAFNTLKVKHVTWILAKVMVVWIEDIEFLLLQEKVDPFSLVADELNVVAVRLRKMVTAEVFVYQACLCREWVWPSLRFSFVIYGFVVIKPRQVHTDEKGSSSHSK